MNTSLRPKIYFFFGVLSMFFSLYVIFISINSGVKKDILFQTAMIIVSLIFIIVACGNFLLAYAISYGRVDRVSGEKRRLLIIKNGSCVENGKKLQIYNDLDRENGNIAKGKHIIVFFCNWKPWSCTLEDFKVDGIKNL